MAGHSELVNKLFVFFSASKAFWLCVLIGSFFSISVLSFEVFYWGGTYLGAMLNIAKACFLVIALLLGFRYYYYKWRSRQYHPMDFLPVLCVISFIFAAFATIILANKNGFSPDGIQNFIVDIYSMGNEYPNFKRIVGSFIIYVYVTLTWLMLYVFIQSERSEIAIRPMSTKSVLFGALSILVTNEIIKIITIKSFYEFPNIIFTFEFLWGEFWLAVVSLFLSLYVFLLRPAEHIFNSSFLPILPTFLVLVFCSSVICMWTTDLINCSYNIFFKEKYYDFIARFSQPFGGNSPVWIHADQFAGLLRSRFNEQLISAIFLLYFSFSYRWKYIDRSTIVKLDVNNSLLFWIYNLVGWTFAGTYLYFSDLLGLSKAGKIIPEVFILSYVLLGFFLSIMLRSIIKNKQISKSSLLILTYKVMCLSFVFGTFLAIALSMVTYLYIFGAFGHQALIDKQEIFNGFHYFNKCLPWFVFCFIVWSLIYQIAVSQRDSLRNDIKQLQLQKNLKEIQLNTLAGKIDPHFIFNALNNIRALVRVDGEKARDSILMLSEILRNPIQKIYQDKIFISEEIILVRNYIKLSQIQLGNRLDYREFIEPAIEQAIIPSMMLQIMIENAIKHGISRLPGGGIISLEICSTGKEILCTMMNTGCLQVESATSGFGVGLKNIKERLSLLYGNRASFQLYEENNSVVAKLTLPLEFVL